MRSLPMRRERTTKARSSNRLALIIVLAGILVLFYPVVATLLSNYHQEKLVEKTREITQVDYSAQERARVIEEARDYNSQLHTGPILDPFLQRVAPKTKLYQDYERLLDFDGVMGAVSIPKIKVNLPIYHGSSDESLARGAGHLFGTALPVGGESTHAVITAHSGLSDATMFDDLTELVVGDRIYVEVAGNKIAYEVESMEKVTPNTTDSLGVVEGKDLLTLITCTPYGINSHRLLVHAHRVELDEVDTSLEELSMLERIWRSWMWLPILVAILGSSFIFFVLRRNREEDEEVAADAPNFELVS